MNRPAFQPLAYARRLRIYRPLRARVVRTLRRSSTATRLASLVAAHPRHTERVPVTKGTARSRARGSGTLPFTPGAGLPNAHSRHLPVVVFVCLGYTPAASRLVARRIAEIQLLTAAFRPLFVVDRADFAAFKEYGFAWEYVTPNEAWANAETGVTWTDHLLDRLAEIVEGYRVRSIVPLPANDPSTVTYECLLTLGATPAD
jgi:hypothetical protein